MDYQDTSKTTQSNTIDLADEEKITSLVFLTITNHSRNQII